MNFDQMGRRRKHETEKTRRYERLARGVYGLTQKPLLPVVPGFIFEPPSYLAARRTARLAKEQQRDGINRCLTMQCFITGTTTRLERVDNYDPRVNPWVGTRDHLVPLRRAVDGQGVDPSRHPSALAWTANVANGTLGLAPLLVRLKIRHWLKTVPFAREDQSLEAGINLRWLLIDMLNAFRIKGRFFWSRNSQGDWWNADASRYLMDEMWEAEEKFLALNEDERDAYIAHFDWNF